MDIFTKQSRPFLTATLAVLGIAVLLVAVGCTSPDGELAVPWHVEAVDTAGDVGLETSIVLSGSGNPHISYYDYTNGDLKYACWNGFSWVGQATAFGLDSVDTAGDVGGNSSIALDGNGYPHISYYDSTNGDLKYARWTAGAWATESVDTAGNVGSYTSIALDGNGYPHISYCGGGGLWYARWTGSAWDGLDGTSGPDRVDTPGMMGFLHSTIVLDGDGYPHISYFDLTNGDLKYAHWTGSAWAIESVDTTGIVGAENSIVLDGNGYAHISYSDATNLDLKYARWTGSAWAIESVDTAGNVGNYTSITLDGNGYPHISYYDVDNSDLKYARWTGSAWSIETVDSAGDVGFYTSIALDGNDRPHISYYDYTNGDLKYARYGE